MDKRASGTGPASGEAADQAEALVGPEPARAPAKDDLSQALGPTRVLADGASDEVSSSADAAGSSSEIRRAVQGAKGGAGQLGDFRLLRKLGEGAMGVVYKARQLSFDRNVALKVLFKHVAHNAKLVERFYREARVAGHLDHPNLVRGYEVGEDGGWHYFAMEYVSGKSLQKILEMLGKLAVPDALYIILHAARALQYAHEQGLVHRDIKPDNILITRKGEVKVGDLGMVKQLDEEMTLTQTGHAVGTPWYMPLEQARNSKDVDARCDIYALGCVLYALLTGQPPFAGKTLVDVIQAKEAGTFPPARQANREVPERLDLILAKMTAKQPRHRYASCAELIRDLERLDLAGDALSFLESGKADPAAALPRPASEAVAPSQPTPVPATAPPDVWYVRYRKPGGQAVQRRLTTAQVLELIEGEHFDPATRASRNANEGYRTLATYREFEPVMLGRAAKSGADRQASRYRKLYKQIEEEDQRKRSQERPGTADGFWLGVLARIAIGLAAAGGAYLLVRWMIAELS
jgi:serine/threonine-protein kinase